jgi:A/G-specific adenine glycosylase
VYQHAYIHFRITLHAFACTLLEKQAPQALHASEICWVAPEELGDFPMGKVDRQISRSLGYQSEEKDKLP